MPADRRGFLGLGAPKTPHTGMGHGPHSPRPITCGQAEDLLGEYRTLVGLGLVKKLPPEFRADILEISRRVLAACDEIGGLQELRYRTVHVDKNNELYAVEYVTDTRQFTVVVSPGSYECLYVKIWLTHAPGVKIEGMITRTNTFDDESKKNIKRYLRPILFPGR